MFNGDIRKDRVAKVMTMASQLTVMEMKSIILQLTHLHDSIILANDSRWLKPEDPNWEDHL
jgi:hypothetical protein